MPANLSVFLQSEGAGESVAAGGGIDEAALNQGVERGLKRSRLESTGDDSGGPTKGFKVYKPDQLDPSDGSANPQKYNFGPVFQMRDIDTQPGGGIVIQKPSENTLRLSIGGVSGYHSTTAQRPEQTAVFRPSLGYSLDSSDPTAVAQPLLYPTLYDPPVQFFATDASPSIAFVTKEVHEVHGGVFYRKDYVAPTEPQGLDDPSRTRNDFLIETQFNTIELRGEVLKHVDDSLVEDLANSDPAYIPVGALSSRDNYIHLYLQDSSTGERSEPEGPFYPWFMGGVVTQLHLDQKYSCWPAGVINQSDLAGTLLGPGVVVTSQTEMRWETLPEQVYALEQGILELSGSSVADIKAQENIQNERIVSLEQETGLAAAPTTPPTAVVQFPDTCLVQRFEYLDKLARGIAADGSAYFAYINPAVSLALFTCPQTTIRGRDGTDGTVDVNTAPLYNAEDLRTKGALGLLWALLPHIQLIRDSLYRVNTQASDPLAPVRNNKTTYVTDYPLGEGPRRVYKDLPNISTNFVFFSPDGPGKEKMTVRWSGPTVNGGEFDINMATQLFSPGFALYDLHAENGIPTRMVTHYDPSINGVSDPYMPIDLTVARQSAGHYIKYEGGDQAIIEWLGDNLIPIAFDVTEGVGDGGPRVPVSIELRDELDRIDIELLRLGPLITATYGAVRGVNDRLARLEAWREAF
jgi:hypothetical protein